MVGTLFAGARVDEGVPLAPLTTLRVGPVAARVITCSSTEQVVAYIDQGYKFMVQVYGYRDAQVYAPRCGACARRHITTSPDGVQANNLNSLPRF